MACSRNLWLFVVVGAHNAWLIEHVFRLDFQKRIAPLRKDTKNMFLMVILVLAAQPAHSERGTVVQARGAGRLTCATAFLPENRAATENWIAGYWTAWDMARVKEATPVAGNSDLNGIVGEVEKVCKEQPSTGLVFAVLMARRAVLGRSAAPR